MAIYDKERFFGKVTHLYCKMAIYENERSHGGIRKGSKRCQILIEWPLNNIVSIKDLNRINNIVLIRLETVFVDMDSLLKHNLDSYRINLMLGSSHFTWKVFAVSLNFVFYLFGIKKSCLGCKFRLQKDTFLFKSF